MPKAEENDLQRAILEGNLQEVEERLQWYSPVFIVSPTPRCGTNFLAHILKLHPAFQLPTLLWEDYVLEHSHLLEDYVYRTSKRWESEVKNVEDCRKLLLRHIGDGIVSFLCEHIEENKRLLCKTPGSYNIDRFFLLFPKAKLLIVVRDGRDTVESAAKTWPNRIRAFERSTWRWAVGARRVLHFMQGVGRDLHGRSWKLVEYEDLVEHPEITVRDLLGFLDIDVDTFDVAQVTRLPLRGSSVHRGGMDRVHWDPVEKPRDFQPIGRWESWSIWRKMTFKVIAGRELIRLGYVDSYHW